MTALSLEMDLGKVEDAPRREFTPGIVPADITMMEEEDLDEAQRAARELDRQLDKRCAFTKRVVLQVQQAMHSLRARHRAVWDAIAAGGTFCFIFLQSFSFFV